MDFQGKTDSFPKNGYNFCIKKKIFFLTFFFIHDRFRFSNRPIYITYIHIYIYIYA